MEVEAFQRAKALPGRVVDIPQLGPRPYFDDVSPRNVTAIVGQSSVLHCRVKNLGQRTVSVLLFYELWLKSKLWSPIACIMLSCKTRR